MVDAERLVSLGTMSTGIAHEINNPLAIINESAGFMKGLISAPEMEECSQKDALLMGLEKIEKSIDRARRITHQLLGYVKKQGSQLCEVDLNVLLDDTLGLLKRELEDKNIRIIRNLSNQKKIIQSNPYQIRQVLVRLIVYILIRFFTTKSFDEGTGLGLFVVHKILSNLNGEIEVKSTLCRGTSFTIKLPGRVE